MTEPVSKNVLGTRINILYKSLITNIEVGKNVATIFIKGGAKLTFPRQKNSTASIQISKPEGRSLPTVAMNGIDGATYRGVAGKKDIVSSAGGKNNFIDFGANVNVTDGDVFLTTDKQIDLQEKAPYGANTVLMNSGDQIKNLFSERVVYTAPCNNITHHTY